MTMIACRVPTAPSAVELTDKEGVSHQLSVTVLGVEETWHTPSLVLAKSSGAGGKVIFSQVPTFTIVDISNFLL